MNSYDHKNISEMPFCISVIIEPFSNVIFECVFIITEELNSKILTPELSDKAKSDLHQELCDLYRMYCDPSAVDRIQFDDDILTQLRSSMSRYFYV